MTRSKLVRTLTQILDKDVWDFSITLIKDKDEHTLMKLKATSQDQPASSDDKSEIRNNTRT